MKDTKRLLKDRGICVVIPTYNNDQSIGEVLKETLCYCDDIIVVNDGSNDNTHEILCQFPSINVVQYTHNKGKGYALKQGFLKALSLGFSYAITLDADGQHYPKDIEVLLEANIKNPGALIIGSRNLENAERSKGSKFANKFSNFWFFVQTGKSINDTQTGYRLYPIKKLYGLKFLTNKYEAELELLVFPSWYGVKLVSAPIDVYYPSIEKRVSHFRPYKDFTRIFILNTVLCILAVAYGLPLRLIRILIKILRTAYSLVFFLFFSLCIITPFVWIYSKGNRNNEKRSLFLNGLIHKCARFVMIKHGIPGVPFRSKLNGEINFNNPYLVICNHQSHLDLMCQLIFSPKMVFLTNDWVWNNPFYGVLIRNAEYYPVTMGIDNLLPKLKSLVDRGYSIAVFPEGTRSADCKINRFHQGAFYIAQQLGIDVLPMYLYGTGKVLPKKTYLLNKWPIYIEVGEPVNTTELMELGSLKQQASWFRQSYINKYYNLSNSIEQDV